MATVRLPHRLHTYSLIIGTVTGLLVAGLAVPFAFGHRAPQGGASSPDRDTVAVLGGAGTPGTSGPGTGSTGSTGNGVTAGQPGPVVPGGAGLAGGATTGGTIGHGTGTGSARGLRLSSSDV